MKQILYIFLLIAVVSCKKNEFDEVERFVRSVKRENYRQMDLPKFNLSHIDALLRHGSDKQTVSDYPRPWFSSYYGGDVQVGLVMLYTVEAIRQQKDWPFLGVRIFDTEDLQRVVSLSEVHAIYTTWWQANKGKSAEALVSSDPLEGTSLAWYGTFTIVDL